MTMGEKKQGQVVVRGNLTGSTTDIVEGELRNTGVELQQQRERLTNTTGSTEDGDLGGLGKRRKRVSAMMRWEFELRESMDQWISELIGSEVVTWLAEAEKARFWKRLKV